MKIIPIVLFLINLSASYSDEIQLAEKCAILWNAVSTKAEW